MAHIAPPDRLLDRAGRPARTAWSLSTDLTHLNHGSFGAVPRAASALQSELMDQMNASPTDWFRELSARVGSARGRIADFLRTDAAGTALIPNASAGISIALASAKLREGDEILVTDHGYGAVEMAAERAATRAGARVRSVPLPLDAGPDEVMDRMTDAIGGRTAMVILDQITSATARLLPVARIAAACRASGVQVLVDGAHAPGMLADPTEGIDADWWVGNLHKWACAPRGTAALVAGSGRREALHPLIDSWGAREPYPQRFDTQGTIDATSFLAAPESFAVIEREFGWDRVREYMGALADYAEDVVGDALDAVSDTPSRSRVGMPAPSMRLLALPGGLVGSPDDAHAVSRRLSEEHGAQTAITCWHGKGYLRLSAHAYNTAADYERFAQDVVPALASLARAA